MTSFPGGETQVEISEKSDNLSKMRCWAFAIQIVPVTQVDFPMETFEDAYPK